MAFVPDARQLNLFLFYLIENLSFCGDQKDRELQTRAPGLACVHLQKLGGTDGWMDGYLTNALW